MKGDLGRVAFIWPSDGLNDDEFLAYLPDDVAWLVNRFPGTLENHSLDIETFKASADLKPMVSAAHMMHSVRPDVVALGDHAGSFINGKGSDLEQRDALTEACGAAHGTTVSTALIRVLQHFNWQRVSVCSPYTEEVTNKGLHFLRQHGIEIAAVESIELSDEHAIAGQKFADWTKSLRRIDRPDAAALVIFGGGLHLASMLNDLEVSIGKPIIPATTALVWDVCRLLGIAYLDNRAGSLVSTLARPPSMSEATLEPVPMSDPNKYSSNENMAQRLSTATKIFALGDAPPVFTSAQGCVLVDGSGKQFLDFACGSGTTVLGHAHPVVMQAVRAQMSTGILHIGPHFHTPSQLALIDRLGDVLPESLNVIQPATNGTEATEAAIKAAMHATGKQKFISFQGSYHGRTLGAMALSHARGSNSILGALIPETVFMPYTIYSPDFEQQLEQYLESGDIAGVIIETVQATAGMRSADPHCLHVIRKLTKRYQVPLIFDEVFTGFGRTGSLFHFQQLGIEPDLLILGKAAGGSVPGALLAGSAALLRHWKPGTQSSTFQMHPLSAATSLATLDELCRLAPWNRVIAIGDRIRAGLQPSVTSNPHVAALHGVGAMWGLEIVGADGKADQPRTKRIRQIALQHGLVTWECGLEGHVIGLIPPLIISDVEIDKAIEILIQAINQV